jgi:Uma2 family endonuclease
MASDATAAAPTRPVRRFTVEQYERMIRAAILGEGTELLEGIIAEKGRHRNGEPIPYRFDREQYHRLIALGILGEDDPVELIRGEVLTKMPHGDPHGTAVEKLNRRLARILPDEYGLRCQLPVLMPDSEPEPDFVVCVPAERRGSTHPWPEEVFLVIEVADSSLGDDRTTKLQLYAETGIAVYWIVNLVDRQIEVYTDPHTPPSGDPQYLSRSVYRPGQQVPLVVAGSVAGAVAVDAVLP